MSALDNNHNKRDSSNESQQVIYKSKQRTKEEA